MFHNKLFKNYYFRLFVIAAVLLFVYNSVQKTREQMTDEKDDFKNMDAAEACRKISSRAEELEAEYGGIANLAQTINPLSFLNPQSYKAGDNKTDDMMRNIINTTVSQESITKISNECAPIATSTQRNEIVTSTKDCKFCDTYPCKITVKNVSQENVDIVAQTCMMQTAIDILLQNTKSIDAQALAQTLQKTQGALSGSNIATKQSCNVVNSNMSSKDYLENIAKCAQVSSTDQTNIIDVGCAAITEVGNIIQKNRAEKLQECIIGTTVDKTLLAEEETKVAAAAKSEQESTGVEMWASIASSCSCCIVILGVAAIGAVIATNKNE